MNLNVRYLEEFVTLTEKKNFLEAAECLFISQSCLSKHIKKLETEIGVELFERTTRTGCAYGVWTDAAAVCAKDGRSGI